MSSHLKIRSMLQAEEDKKAEVLPVGVPSAKEQWLLAGASVVLTLSVFLSHSTRIDDRALPLLLGGSYAFLSTVLVWIVWRTSGGDDRRLKSAWKEYGAALVGVRWFAILVPMIFSGSAAIVSKRWSALSFQWYVLPGLAGWVASFFSLSPARI